VILQWTPAQIHDTVAAIARQREFGGANRQSLIGRALRYLLQRFDDLLELLKGSLDARLLLGAAIIIVIGTVLARVYAERRAAERKRRGGVRGSRTERRDLWRVAEELAAAGQLDAASHAVYAALIGALTRSGIVRFHESKTAGDYARDLRRAGVRYAGEFREFGREFDRAVFGVDVVSRAEYERLAELAARLASVIEQRSAA
jgi:hypothetical protein